MRDEMTYGEYLRIPELLSLQQLQSDSEHDELLFITIHQVYELWFQQILHELDRLAKWMDDDELVRGSHQLVRVLKILKTMVGQLDVLETMTPLEFLLGHRRRTHLDRFEGTADHARLQARWDAPSLWQHFLAVVARRGFELPGEVLEAGPGTSTEPHHAVQDALVEVYRTDPELTEFCELLTDMDEGLMEWRYRHMMMVMRTIGTKPGTGGSAGADYLRSTLFHPVFPDLWEIRTRL